MLFQTTIETTKTTKNIIKITWTALFLTASRLTMAKQVSDVAGYSQKRWLGSRTLRSCSHRLPSYSQFSSDIQRPTRRQTWHWWWASFDYSLESLDACPLVPQLLLVISLTSAWDQSREAASQILLKEILSRIHVFLFLCLFFFKT